MKRMRIPSAKAFVSGALLGAAALLPAACLDRPVGEVTPQTTNILVDQLVQSGIDKIDMLFVIDNSISMADKQAILAEALPDLVDRFVSPICVDENGTQVDHPADGQADCASGAREFKPINDIHIGVITTSLGGYGAPQECVSEQAIDMAHLVGSLARGANTGGQFLAWNEGSNRGTFVQSFTSQVVAAGEFGCGWEAPLEAWYRFLVDPYPYKKVVRQNCPGTTDMAQLCIGPELTATGEAIVDGDILAQRKAFLRPDSLAAIIMLSDENDCSFRASGQSWRLAQATNPPEDVAANGPINRAFKATSVCATNPNDNCCHSCGSTRTGCPTEPLQEQPDVMVGVGCGAGRLYLQAGEGGEGPSDDEINLRCFQQKRRFGVDYLYPIRRYSNALTKLNICPFADDLDESSTLCRVEGGSLVAENPLFADLQYDPMDPNAIQAVPRPANLVFLAGIVGVPWQDLAQTVSGALPNAPLKYRVNAPIEGAIQEDTLVQWQWIVGDPVDPDPAVNSPPGGIPNPQDPMMIESIEPRTGLGTNPVTGEAPAAPESGARANSINGHEWTNADHRDLQYACTFPINKTDDCPTKEEVSQFKDDNPGASVPNCDCTEHNSEESHNPLCQDPNSNTYGYRQHFAKAYPSLRQLQVLREFGANSIVASICPKEVDPEAPDYGYRPAVAAIVDTLKKQLKDKCLPRPLAIKEDENGNLTDVQCLLIEAKNVGTAGATCDGLPSRENVEPQVANVVKDRLLSTKTCSSKAECDKYRLCKIPQLAAGERDSCLNSLSEPNGDGWCYVDPGLGQGSQAVVDSCPATEQRKVRFAGDGTPEKGTTTFFACAGESLRGGDAEPADAQ